jgi:hypothetical protein
MWRHELPYGKPFKVLEMLVTNHSRLIYIKSCRGDDLIFMPDSSGQAGLRYSKRSDTVTSPHLSDTFLLVFLFPHVSPSFPRLVLAHPPNLFTCTRSLTQLAEVGELPWHVFDFWIFQLSYYITRRPRGTLQSLSYLINSTRYLSSSSFRPFLGS